LQYTGCDDENVIIHIFCVIVRDDASVEEWYIEAERQLLYDRLVRAHVSLDEARRISFQHADAVREHIPRVRPPPDPETVREIDTYHLFTKLLDVRSYLRRQ
jgi:hypothetical protein